MAEERLIDDDLNKDKKYKIRKNADGEDELYFDETEEQEEQEEEINDGSRYEVPDLGYDDEEAAILTPEQLIAREEAKREEEKKRAERCGQLLAEAQTKLENSDFDNALYAISLIEEIDKECGRAYFLKFKALSSAFTDFSRSDDLKAAADCVNKFCTLEERAELLSLCAPLKAKLDDDEEKAAALHVENEQKKREPPNPSARSYGSR